MMLEESAESGGETPLEQRLPPESEMSGESSQREEREADAVIDDVDRYVAQTDPGSLAAAEAELNAWEIPVDPLDLAQEGQSAGFGGAEPQSVFSAASESEARIVQGVLEAAGIPARLHDVAMPSMGNIFAAGEQGWGDVFVPANLARQARRAIEEALRSSSQNE